MMKRRILMLLIGLVVMSAANAQYLNDSERVFTQGKWYGGLSASGFDLNYHKAAKWSIDLDAKGGYFVADDWLVLGNLGYQNQTYGSSTFSIGAGVRYYIEQNGLYGGLGASFVHAGGIDDFKPELNVGYAYFLTRNITIEPEVYFQMSTEDDAYNGFGFRLGFGIYF